MRATSGSGSAWISAGACQNPAATSAATASPAETPRLGRCSKGAGSAGASAIRAIIPSPDSTEATGIRRPIGSGTPKRRPRIT
ncbi:hypothetical protein [Humitalea rosea]|uniref:hypothetical protein n=1 Tax=Humitalea rosea TaxID=990373 RepID=UPI000DAB7260|nr:hypothetical protein [Humitalea rosea]